MKKITPEQLQTINNKFSNLKDELNGFLISRKIKSEEDLLECHYFELMNTLAKAELLHHKVNSIIELFNETIDVVEIDKIRLVSLFLKSALTEKELKKLIDGL